MVVNVKLPNMTENIINFLSLNSAIPAIYSTNDKGWAKYVYAIQGRMKNTILEGARYN